MIELILIKKRPISAVLHYIITKKLQMETMETASMKALATAPNAAAAYLLDQRVPRGPLEVCLACAGLIESLSTSDAFIIDSLLFKLMREPRAEERTEISHFWA